jgi:hypothetical protein
MTYKVSGTSMILVALCFMLGAAPSFAGPPNNDVSDAGRNTAGGSGALFNNSTGVDNTAFGFLGLASNTVGSSNTAFGKSVLRFEHRKVQKLEAAIARQQEEIKALTASVKMRASQVRKVSAQLEVSKATPQMAVNNQ